MGFFLFPRLASFGECYERVINVGTHTARCRMACTLTRISTLNSNARCLIATYLKPMDRRDACYDTLRHPPPPEFRHRFIPMSSEGHFFRGDFSISIQDKDTGSTFRHFPPPEFRHRCFPMSSEGHFFGGIFSFTTQETENCCIMGLGLSFFFPTFVFECAKGIELLDQQQKNSKTKKLAHLFRSEGLNIVGRISCLNAFTTGNLLGRITWS